MERDNDKWECSACTYLNNVGTQRCEICDTRRTATTLGGGGRVTSSSSSSNGNGDRESILGNRISQGLLLGALGAGGLALFRGSSVSDVFREAVNGATLGALAGNLIEQTSIDDSPRFRERDRERERRRLRQEEETEMFRRLENWMLSPRMSARRTSHGNTRFNINDAFLHDMIQGMYQNMSPREIHQLIHERYTRSGGRGEIPSADEIDNMSYEDLVQRYPQNPIPAPASLVDNLTEYKYPKKEKQIDDIKEDECEECSVCLGKFVEDESLKLLPCSHKFHKECIETWLSRSGMCPICKYRLGP